jgi:hypothetical protein
MQEKFVVEQANPIRGLPLIAFLWRFSRADGWNAKTNAPML